MNYNKNKCKGILQHFSKKWKIERIFEKTLKLFYYFLQTFQPKSTKVDLFLQTDDFFFL